MKFLPYLVCLDALIMIWLMISSGLSMGMGFLWETSRGMGWDWTVHICISHFSTSFWRYPLKNVRRKALGWISYFTYQLRVTVTLHWQQDIIVDSPLLKSVIFSFVHFHFLNRPNCYSNYHTDKPHHLPSQSTLFQPEAKPILTNPL